MIKYRLLPNYQTIKNAGLQILAILLLTWGSMTQVLAESRSDWPAGPLALQRWDAGDPQFAGGLKTTNTARENMAVFTDLFEKMNAAGPGDKFLRVPAGTYNLVGSLSPSGRESTFKTGGRLTILFERCVFNFSGARADYNQITLQGRELDSFTIDPKKPYRRGDTVSSGGAMPFVAANGHLRKMAVLFDLSNCSSGDKGIHVMGYLELNGPASMPFNSGIVGMCAGRLTYGFAKGSTWDAVKITGCDIGLLHLRVAEASADLGDGFTSARFNFLDIRNCGRALVFDGNGADMMDVGKGTIACRDTSYFYRTHVHFGALFANTTCGEEVSLKSPNPKILEVMGGTLMIDELYGRGGKSPKRAWSVINVADSGVLTIGCMHIDMNHDAQSGAAITLAASDNGHVSLAGTVTINGTGNEASRNPLKRVVGIVPHANAARYANVVTVNAPFATKPGGTEPIGILPDYASDTPSHASTRDYLFSFGQHTGARRQTITDGTFVDY